MRGSLASGLMLLAAFTGVAPLAGAQTIADVDATLACCERTDPDDQRCLAGLPAASDYLERRGVLCPLVLERWLAGLERLVVEAQPNVAIEALKDLAEFGW